MQAIELERSPTRDEIERELVRVKNAPRRLPSINETSPSSRVSDAHANLDMDWRRSMEKNIERIMQHLQIPVVTHPKAASAKTSSSSESTGSDTSRRPHHIQETITVPQVLIRTWCVLSSSLHESLDVGVQTICLAHAPGYGYHEIVNLNLARSSLLIESFYIRLRLQHAERQEIFDLFSWICDLNMRVICSHWSAHSDQAWLDAVIKPNLRLNIVMKA